MPIATLSPDNHTSRNRAGSAGERGYVMTVSTRLSPLWNLLVSSAFLSGCLASQDAASSCAVDEFSSPSIDTRRWGIYEQPPTTIYQRDGELVATLADRAAAYASVYSVEDLDFRDTSVAVEVLRTPSAPGAEVLLQWVVNNRFRHFIAAEADRLSFGTQNDSVYETRDLPYDPDAHRNWRLRHDEARDRVFYETSRDRATWVVQYDTATLVPLQDAYVELAAGTYQEVSGPTDAAFDNFELTARCAR